MTPTQSASARVHRIEDAMSKWQLISSAPKDGTSVLLWSTLWKMSWGIEIGAFRGGKWHTSKGSVDENEEGFDPDAEVDCEFDQGPTHWMPLPSPPA